MAAMDQLRTLVGIQQACRALAVPRASWYRRRRRRLSPVPAVAAQRHYPEPRGPVRCPRTAPVMARSGRRLGL